MWNGSAWSSIGSGVNNSAAALAISGSTLYVGGAFSAAGQTISAYAAGAIINLGNWLAIHPGASGAETLTYVGLPNTAYLMQFATNLPTGQWSLLATNTTSPYGVGTVPDSHATNSQRFYRVMLP